MRKAKPQPSPELPEFEDALILERPDGFYWKSKITGEEAGPFKSIAEAIADMEYTPESDYEPGESLEEAEAQIGISDWIDPETGVPAEEGVPRIEEH